MKFTDEIRQAYAQRDKSPDSLNPDAPVLPPEAWANGVIGKYYRPMKAKGQGHLTRINEILRERMAAEMGQQQR